MKKFYFFNFELSLYDEFVHFYAHCTSQGLQVKYSLNLLKFLCKNDLYPVFLNVEIHMKLHMACLFVLQLHITVPISPFLAWKESRHLCSTISEYHLNSLIVMNIEADILLKFDYEKIITNVATKKSETKGFLIKFKNILHTSK